MCPTIHLSWLGMQAIGLTLLIFVAWPLLTLPAGIFSRNYFRFWIVLAMIWGTLAGMAVAIALKPNGAMLKGALAFRHSYKHLAAGGVCTCSGDGDILPAHPRPASVHQRPPLPQGTAPYRPCQGVFSLLCHMILSG